MVYCFLSDGQRWSVLAGCGLIVLLIAVCHANNHMALYSELYTYAWPLTLWLRLPLQFVLIAWAYWCTRPGSLNVNR